MKNYRVTITNRGINYKYFVNATNEKQAIRIADNKHSDYMGYLAFYDYAVAEEV